jgi:hypothetical protein
MTLRLVDSGWGAELTRALQDDPTALRVISPFIKLRALERLLATNAQSIQVITRLNLDDFAAEVSDIAALRRVLEAGGQVRGIKNLHAKLYLFGASRAIITSANLTVAALDRNQEFGAVTQDPTSLTNCMAYFDRLWNLGIALQPVQLDQWEKVVRQRRAAGLQVGQVASLGDFGADAGLQPAPTVTTIPTADASRAFVKLLGESDNRVLASCPTVEEIKRSGCHRVLAYPHKKRPRSVPDGALMFIGRMTKRPADILVFGRAIGQAYVPGRDDATDSDKALRPWRSQWSRYIRVDQPEFVAGCLSNGLSLNALIDALDFNAFASTKRRAATGESAIKPRRAYGQAPHVELSPEGLAWLRDRLQLAFDSHGVVPRDTLAALP